MLISTPTGKNTFYSKDNKTFLSCQPLCESIINGNQRFSFQIQPKIHISINSGKCWNGNGNGCA